MEYWTILLVTVLGGPLDGLSFGIPYASEQACKDATRAVSSSFDYDHNMVCDNTGLLSESIRPKHRPEGLGE